MSSAKLDPRCSVGHSPIVSMPVETADEEEYVSADG
jgi:hypothetical protein